MLKNRLPPPKNTNYSEWDRRVTDYSNADLYVNLNVFNPVDSGINIPVIYEEQRVQSLFDDPKDWKCAVVSLYCPSTSIPLLKWDNFLPDGITPTYTLTLTVMNYGGGGPPISVTQQVLFTPYNTTQYVFLFNQIVISINVAFAAAFAALIVAYDAAHAPGAWVANPLLPQTAPYIYNDTNDSLFTLVVPYLYNAQTNNSNPINPNPALPFVQISFNYALDGFFVNFPSVDQGPTPAVGNNIVLKVYDSGAPGWLSPSDRYIPAVPALPGFQAVDGNWQYNVKQQNSTTSLISDIKAIVIESNMPLRYEYTNVVDSATGSLGALGILSDFAVSFDASGNGESERPLLYSPSPQFKWIDIQAADTFTRLNYSLSFVDQRGEFFPVMLQPGQTASMKLLFSKK